MPEGEERKKEKKKNRRSHLNNNGWDFSKINDILRTTDPGCSGNIDNYLNTSPLKTPIQITYSYYIQTEKNTMREKSGKSQRQKCL